jgi:hypothetical protein
VFDGGRRGARSGNDCWWGNNILGINYRWYSEYSEIFKSFNLVSHDIDENGVSRFRLILFHPNKWDLMICKIIINIIKIS